MEDLIVIKSYPYRHEAGVAKGLLDSEGIDAVIAADDVGGYRPHLTFSGQPIQLLVKQENVEKAKRILQVLEVPVDEGDKDLQQKEQEELVKKHSSSPIAAVIFILLSLLLVTYSVFGAVDFNGRVVLVFIGFLLFIASIGMLYAWKSVQGKE